MFFAVLSLGISIFLLFTVYDNGRMMKNAQDLFKDVKPALDRLSEKTGSDLKWDRIGARVQEIQTRIAAGDKSAGLSLDGLRRDLETMRDFTSERSGEWIEQVSQTLAKAREEMERNGPAAADRLRELADRIKARDDKEKARPALPKDAHP